MGDKEGIESNPLSPIVMDSIDAAFVLMSGNILLPSILRALGAAM